MLTAGNAYWLNLDLTSPASLVSLARSQSYEKVISFEQTNKQTNYKNVDSWLKRQQTVDPNQNTIATQL